MSHQKQTLTLRIALKSLTPGLWTGWLVNQQTVVPLWFRAIPAVSPELLFDAPLQNFPSVGPVAVVTTLINGSPGVCGDARIIDTGTP